MNNSSCRTDQPKAWLPVSSSLRTKTTVQSVVCNEALWVKCFLLQLIDLLKWWSWRLWDVGTRLIGLSRPALLIHYIQQAIWEGGDGDAVLLVNLSSPLSSSCSGSKSAGKSFRLVDYVHLALLTHWSSLWLTFVRGRIDHSSETQKVALKSMNTPLKMKVFYFFLLAFQCDICASKEKNIIWTKLHADVQLVNSHLSPSSLPVCVFISREIL